MLYLLLFLAFILQEPISSNAILLEVYQYHHPLWIVHVLFVVATMLDAIFLYRLGAWFHTRYAHTKFVAKTKQKSERFVRFASKNGVRLALVVFGPSIFPLSAFIAPWLEISFWDAFVFLFIGDVLLWYLPEWLIVLGVKSFVHNTELALVAVLLVSFAVFGHRYLSRRVK